MKNILLTITVIFLTISLVSNAQDITNTLAPNGEFKIKDSSTDYFILNQSNGTISLISPLAGNIRGSIFKGTDRFLHTYHGPGTEGLNTFLGINAGNFTMGGGFFYGSYNTGVGYQSLLSLTTGSYNSAFGTSSLNKNITGSYNSAFGTYSLFYNTGDYNSAFGTFSLSNNTTGYSNSAFGGESLIFNTTGNENSAFGTLSLRNNTTGYENSAFGFAALNENSTGWHNTAVGFDALRNNLAGFQNTAVGHHSLQNNSSNYNTAIGYNAGSTVTTGYNLTLVGIDANPSSPTANDQITLGNIFISSLRCNVQTITSLSDARDKKNIQELSLGLDFITKLKPRQFNWDRREWYEKELSDGSKIQEEPTAGFIAQEFDEIQKSENAEWLNLVLKDNPEKWEATYGNLLPVMVKAIQELKIKNEQLKIEKDEEIAELTIKNEELRIEKDEEIAEFKTRLAKFEEMQAMLVKKIEQIESNEQKLKVQIVNSENNNQ